MASAWSEADPAATPAPISARNIAALTANAIHSARRHRGAFDDGAGEHPSVPQHPAICHLVLSDAATQMGPVAATGSRAMEGLSIGALARATGTGVETIRYYERIGLLPAPARTAGNYRSYDAGQLGRLSFIRRARDLGFPLDRVRALLGLADERDRPCEAVDAIAREHLAEVERKIADLAALRDELTDLIGRCRHDTVADCRIIGTLAPLNPG